MPSWGELLRELGALKTEFDANPPDMTTGVVPPSAFDLLRRKYTKRLSELTGRATIVYGTAFTEEREYNARFLQIGLGDMQGFMEVCSHVDERALDLVLHSPGGDAQAAESILEYLRTQFDHIRAVGPLAAMSAATMVALGADEIVMGAHSQLGPIDPQFTIATPEGPRSAPGQAILDQFEKARDECQADPAKLPAWLPILRSYAPGLLTLCEHQRTLAENLVAKWLAKYMFPGDTTRASEIAAWFADFKEFLSHARRVGLDEAREQGLKITALEDDDELQDAVLSVHHSLMLTFAQTPTPKIIENHLGHTWLKIQPPPATFELVPADVRPPFGPAPMNRAERRRAQREGR